MVKQLVAGIIILCLAIPITIYDYSNHMKDINNTINSKNGTVISIDERYINSGPFYMRQKNQHIYKVEYMDNNTRVVEEAWIRTGFFEDEWVWDYKE